MSGSESDDEFLSADEGDYEESKKNDINMEEDEVDEIMDLLMNKESGDKTLPANSSQSHDNLDEPKNQAVSSKQVEEEPSNESATDSSKMEKESKDTKSTLDEEEEESLEDIFTREYEKEKNKKLKENKNNEQLPHSESISCTNKSRTNSEIEVSDSIETVEASDNEVSSRHGISTQSEPNTTIVSKENDSDEIELKNELDDKTASNETIEQKDDTATISNSIETVSMGDSKEEQNEDENDSSEDQNASSNNVKTDNTAQTQQKDDTNLLEVKNSISEKVVSDNDNQGSDDLVNTNNDIRNEIEAGDDGTAQSEEHDNHSNEDKDSAGDKAGPDNDAQAQLNHSSNNDNIDEMAENLDDLDLDDDDEPNEKDIIKESDIDDKNNGIDCPKVKNEIDKNNMQTSENESKKIKEENKSETKAEKLSVTKENSEDNEADNGWNDWGNEDIDNKEMEKEAESMISTPVSNANMVPKEPTPHVTTPSSSSSSKDDWGWDNWADDFIIQAAGKVSNLLETVEGQLGIPDPTKMAEVVSKEEKDEFLTKKPVKKETAGLEVPKDTPKPQSSSIDNELKESSTKDTSSGVSSWFGGFSSISGLVQNTGSDLVSGGIGALEFIGKKTVDMLSDGDPGLRQKREALSGKKTNSLSAVLREAKSSSENNAIPSRKQEQSKSTQADDVRFIDLFEKFQGNAHLDALEMLSNECENKVERILNLQSDLSRDETTKLLSTTRENYELSENIDERESNADFKKDLFADTKKLKMKVTCSKLLNTWLKIKEKSTQPCSIPKECLEHAMSGLAEFVSRCIEYYRKIADMLMVTDIKAKDFAVERAKTLKNITEMLQVELTCLANNFAEQLADNADDTAQKIVTDIYLEGSNCSSMVKDCHELLLPILQCCIIK